MTSPTTPPTIRRGYASTSLGQVHYRELAGPSIGSTLDEKCEALLLLHQTADSSTQFLELMTELAGQVRVIAADTPGYGASDRIPAGADPPSVADYARAMSEHYCDPNKMPRWVVRPESPKGELRRSGVSAW